MWQPPAILDTREPPLAGVSPTTRVIEAEEFRAMAERFGPVIVQAVHGNFAAAHELINALARETHAPRPTTHVLEWTLQELGLPVRIANALETRDILTVRQLLATPRLLVESIGNIGPQTLATLDELLGRQGLTWPE